MIRWHLDPAVEAERIMAERWMRYVRYHGFYAQAVLINFNVLGHGRGMLGLLSTAESTQLYCAGQDLYFVCSSILL